MPFSFLFAPVGSWETILTNPTKPSMQTTAVMTIFMKEIVCMQKGCREGWTERIEWVKIGGQKHLELQSKRKIKVFLERKF